MSDKPCFSGPKIQKHIIVMTLFPQHVGRDPLLQTQNMEAHNCYDNFSEARQSQTSVPNEIMAMVKVNAKIHQRYIIYHPNIIVLILSLLIFPPSPPSRPMARTKAMQRKKVVNKSIARKKVADKVVLHTKGVISDAGHKGLLSLWSARKATGAPAPRLTIGHASTTNVPIAPVFPAYQVVGPTTTFVLKGPGFAFTVICSLHPEVNLQGDLAVVLSTDTNGRTGTETHTLTGPQYIPSRETPGYEQQEEYKGGQSRGVFRVVQKRELNAFNTLGKDYHPQGYEVSMVEPMASLSLGTWEFRRVLSIHVLTPNLSYCWSFEKFSLLWSRMALPTASYILLPTMLPALMLTRYIFTKGESVGALQEWLMKSNSFHALVGFEADKFQPALASGFLEAVLQEHFYHCNPRFFEDSFSAGNSLGSHTSIVYLHGNSESPRRYLWHHPARAPFGVPIPVSCPNCANPSSRISKKVHKQGSRATDLKELRLCLECRLCKACFRFTKPADLVFTTKYDVEGIWRFTTECYKGCYKSYKAEGLRPFEATMWQCLPSAPAVRVVLVVADDIGDGVDEK
ncbi:hypothetical protein B0H16DRAFT_1452494 [Mycena metata]|uniref:Uncharacterized protein n=1 Tax=Mycena metata TaxID=1033252 RepID=A0AAD7JPJ7_9AGAR|nr:hypothetical protein B0H16DRAFT_1452494 [Mycena metata]